MDFMTKEYVAEQAKISDEAALLCSIEHYDQMLAASEKEYGAAQREGVVNFGPDFCALCQRHCEEGTCPMNTDCAGSCFDAWGELSSAYSCPWHKVHSAMAEVRRVLQEKYDELYPKKKGGFEPIRAASTIVSVQPECPYPVRIDIGMSPWDLYSIKELDAIIAALQKAKAYVAKAEPKKEEVFYHTGQKFERNGQIYRLCMTEGFTANLIYEDGKGCWSKPVKVGTAAKITEAEFAEICNGQDFTLIE